MTPWSPSVLGPKVSFEEVKRKRVRQRKTTSNWFCGNLWLPSHSLDNLPHSPFFSPCGETVVEILRSYQHSPDTVKTLTTENTHRPETPAMILVGNLFQRTNKSEAAYFRHSSQRLHKYSSASACQRSKDKNRICYHRIKSYSRITQVFISEENLGCKNITGRLASLRRHLHAMPNWANNHCLQTMCLSGEIMKTGKIRNRQAKVLSLKLGNIQGTLQRRGATQGQIKGTPESS